MRRLLLIIPISAAVIAGLLAFKLTRHYDPPSEQESAAAVRPAPLLKLYDQKSEIVRLERYVGRSKLLMVFYDGSRGPEDSSLLTTLRERYADLHATGAVVLAISAARPSENRYGKNLEHRKGAGENASTAASEEIRYPFPVLSDILYDWHRQYGAFDEKSRQPREAVFIVDRAGYIEYEHIGPDRLGQIEDWIRELREVR